MLKRLFTTPRAFQTRLLMVVALLGCLAWLALTFFRQPVRDAVNSVPAAGAAKESVGQKDEPRALAGEQARAYLEQTGDGQSLMQAATVARFGLKREEQSPFDKESGAGYLGTSHAQNLNAWFAEDGVTIRPTISEKKRQQAWQLGFSLKAYGYGEHLQPATPIVSHNVKDNRIEYVRADSSSQITNTNLEVPVLKFQILDAGLNDARSLLSLQPPTRNPQLIEWYENRAEGIEQGFTLNARPERSGEVAANEP
nr:hypothetical protein [Acidobacteriota bacterium]